MKDKLYIDGIEVDLPEGGSGIVLNRAVSKPADMSTILSGYSYTIQLPKTSHNVQILGFSTEVNVESDFPHVEHTAKVIRDGITLFDDGVAVVKSASKTIEVFIQFGGNKRLSSLNNYKLKDLFSENVLIPWDYNVDQTDFVKWVPKLDGMQRQHPEHLRPAVKVSTLFDMIVGQSFMINASYRSVVEKMWLMLPTTNGSEEVARNMAFRLKGTTTSDQISNRERYDILPDLNYQNAPFHQKLYDLIYRILPVTYIKIPLGGRYQIEGTIKANNAATGWKFGIFNLSTEFVEGEPPVFDIYQTAEKDINEYVDIPTGDICFGIYDPFKTGNFEIDLTISFAPESEKDYSQTAFLLDYPIRENLPDMSIMDFIKSVMGVFGLMVEPKSDSLVFFNVNDVISNKSEAVDISKMLVDKKEDKLEYSYGLTKKNVLKYAEDDLVDKSFGSYMFVANTYEKQETTVYQSPYAATDNNIPLYTRKIEDGKVDYVLNKTSKCRLLLEDGIESLEVWGKWMDADMKTVDFLSFTFDPLKYENLAQQYWGGYLGVFANSPRISYRKCLLSPTFFPNMSFSQPVYAEGNYYMILSMNNYSENGLANIELALIDGVELSRTSLSGVLLEKYDSPIKFDLDKVALYNRTGSEPDNGKMIRELDDAPESLDVSKTFVAIDKGSGPALKIPVGEIAGNVSILQSKDPIESATEKNVFSALAALAHFLRKDAPDVAEKLLKFLEGAEFGIFESGPITGTGGKIWANGHAELASLLLRGWLEVPEIRYNRVQVVGGELWVTDGAKFDTVTQSGDLFNIKIKLEEGELVTFWVGDILKGVYHDKSTDGKFKGFRTLWFRVTAVDQTNQTITVASRYSGDSKYNPVKYLEVARIGSFTEASRQRSILIDSKENCITFLDHVNTWDITPNMEVCWLGRKDRTIPGVPSTAGYNAKLSNIIMSGKIFQYDEITGTDYLVPIDKGTYVDGQRYAYYDRVSAPGGLWLCVNEAGTTQRPNKGSSDWLLQVADGSTPEPAGTWNDYTNYVKNNIVTLDGDSYIALRDNINERPKKNYGGYLTTGGKYLTTGGKRLYTGDINPAWMLLAEKGLDGSDGVNGKDGESILWKGELPSHPANPQNGWSYRNTTDGKSYVYQDGSWYLMTIDGIDGKNGKDGISITWKGDLSTPPSDPELNWVYRDTDNGKVYIWNGNAWALMVVDGTDGADGADGKDGFSVFITYNDQLSEPAIPTGDGTTGGWHTNTSPAVIWMSQKVAASATEGTWGKPIKIKGDKGINFITEDYSPYKEYKVGDVVPFNGGKIYCKKDNTGQTPVPILSTGGKLLKTGNFYLLYKPLAVNTINSEYWEIFVDRPVKEEIEQTFTAYFVGSPNVTPPTPILTGNSLGWSTTVPTTFNWVSQKRAISIASGSWSKPVRMTAEDGKDGLNATTRWLTSTTAVVRFNSIGNPTPSSVVVSCKKQTGILPVEACSDLYLTYRTYADTTYVSQSTPTKTSSVTIGNLRTDGVYYVRGYEKESDAKAWNGNFTTEFTITHANDGEQGERGLTGASPRVRGIWDKSISDYVWNNQWRDIVLVSVNGVTQQYAVKAEGTVPANVNPTTEAGKSYWESAQKFKFIATDLLLADKIKGDMIDTNTLKAKYVETSDSGNRIIIDPIEKCLKMINSDNKEITRLDFFVTSTRSGPRLAFDLYDSGVKKANLVMTAEGLSIYDDYVYAPFFAVDAIGHVIRVNADRMPQSRNAAIIGQMYMDGETLKVKREG